MCQKKLFEKEPWHEEEKPEFFDTIKEVMGDYFNLLSFLNKSVYLSYNQFHLSLPRPYRLVRRGKLLC